MFIQPELATGVRTRARGILAGSVAVHLGLLALLLLLHPDAVRLTPYWVARGDSGKSYRVIYVPTGGEEVAPPDIQKFTAPRALPRKRYHNRPHPFDPAPAIDADIAEKTSHAGSQLGTTITGMVAGHEVKLAFPLVFPDPPIPRSELPQGLQGDVIVEVTIDSQGQVVETKVLQAIGHGLDEKILSTLRTWKFTPATLDGVPVASKHDVHFHFPS
jgi:TonB family protein